MYNYSIIIPHKNIPKLLEQCLASIPQRDDVQIIVVDDNSDPAAVDFVHFPGLGRAHTEVIFTHEEDGRKGAGYARNVGMERARGKWLVFADADDLFLPSIAEMMDKYPDSKADIVFFGNTHVDSETMLPIDDTHQMRHIAAYLSTNDEDNLRYRMFAPWAKFVNRQFVSDNELRFSEIQYSNDLFFSIRSGHFASSIECEHVPVYCYLRRRSSISGVGNESVDIMSVRFDEDVRILRFLKSVGKRERYMEIIAMRRWKKIMRADRRRAMPLLRTLKELYPANEIMELRLKFVFEPLVAQIRKITKNRNKS